MSASPPATPPTSDTSPGQSPPTNATTVANTPPVNGSAVPPLAPSGPFSTAALAGLIVGIVIGGLLVLTGVGVFVIFRMRRKEAAASHPQAPRDEPSSCPPPPDSKVTMLPMPVPSPGILPDPDRPSVHDPAFLELHCDSLGSGNQLRKSFTSATPLGFSESTFTYKELAIATDGFSDANLIGQGGFGYVHKGVLPNGKVVAIKHLKAGSGQGEREFQAEVEIISRVHHRHLVSLVGYCSTGVQRMLVYEYVPNNTLEYHLHGKGQLVMSWTIRMKIALGSAKGLAYLHEACQPKIIHRDIKASNILLDYSFLPKVADFGLAKSALDTDTHVSTRVMGTFGYMAPEYASTGRLTDKSDVFSFGVVLLELITGRRPVDRTQSFVDEGIVDWAKPLLTQALENGNFDSLVDSRLQKDYDPNEMARLIACAAACVRHSASLRPRMSKIVRALEGNVALDDLNEGSTPGDSMIYSFAGSSEYNSNQYKEDLQKFRKLALETEEHGSSEYSGSTISEYVPNQSSSSNDGQQTGQETEEWKMDKDTKKDL
ncbi:Pkinase_Tyr domain-containing protein [Cephalotus follicularis]|uniref:non-specific serine/threonine protein kinase n=1 Tax=Cephalotus follicularis TaxID=3775 RepID=A0A1Q3B8X7_CEPFO|nr:Pkinase_Tyr domain-containing protein [Cephalotus follicularis]